MPQSPRANRLFVAGFVALMLGLATLATVLILRGWADPEQRARVEAIEDARREPAR